MPKTISKILRSEKRDKNGTDYLAVSVVVVDELGNKEECMVYVGGSVEVYLVNQEIRAFVRKYKD